MNDLAMTIDLASPLFPKYFLLMACLGSLARAVTGERFSPLTQTSLRCM